MGTREECERVTSGGGSRSGSGVRDACREERDVRRGMVACAAACQGSLVDSRRELPAREECEPVTGEGGTKSGKDVCRVVCREERDVRPGRVDTCRGVPHASH
mmetsp:Transcript_84037/g.262460  ORF Transcript_84037/g.262460 Transcript_84037/m.262460 type:complete len:103 (+) Transcript_84037:381-689(+)